MTVDIAAITRYELTEDCTTGVIDVTPVPASMKGRFVLYEDVAGQLEAAQARIAELKSETVFPGVMYCHKCSFSRTHINIDTETGEYTAGDSTPESCPNGCGAMRADTYRSQYNKLYDYNKSTESELLEARARIAELESKQEPYLYELWTLDTTSKKERWFLSERSKDKQVALKNQKVVTLYTDPPKPVITLPDGYKPCVRRGGSQSTTYRAMMTFGGEWLHRDSVVETLGAAGIVVKDGEQ